MKKTIVRMLALVAAAAVLAGGAGCGSRKTTSRMSTGSTHGRQLTAVIDERASFRTQGDDHIITFGGHELVVRKERLVVDGDKGSFGIPAGARKVEIKVARGILTLSADGAELIKTPI
jgi:hypothetical protein